jgi:hypothetical protein
MDDEMALFVKRFGKFMVKKGYRARRKKSSSKNKEESRRCFKCGSKDHLVAQCPYNSDNDDDDKKSKKKYKKEKKEKKDKMTTKKKKKGGSYVVTWDSDASSSDDDKTTKKKALVSIAIQEKPSVFDTPSCFMAKAIKVQICDDECDEEHDNKTKSESDNDDEPTKDELIDILKDAKEYFDRTKLVRLKTTKSHACLTYGMETIFFFQRHFIGSYSSSLPSLLFFISTSPRHIGGILIHIGIGRAHCTAGHCSKLYSLQVKIG